jgi:hypothetical protein
MACLLAAGIGSFAVWADGDPKLPPPVAPPPVPVASGAPRPDLPKSAPIFRSQMAVDKQEDPTYQLPVGHPRMDAVGGVYTSTEFVMYQAKPADPVPAPAVPPTPPPAPVQPAPEPPMPPAPITDRPAAPPPVAPEPVPPPPATMPAQVAMPPAPTVSTPPAPMPMTPIATGLPATPPPPASPFPWKLSLEVVNGLSQIELRHSDELLMRVQADKLAMNTPSGGLQATGRVAITGPCVEARCDRLTIAWATGQVALDGGVRLAFQNKGTVHEMRAESVCFRLNGANQPVDFSAGDVRKVAATAP